MRMWKVEPSKMCSKHLRGEHVEMHMFVGCIIKNKSILGYINKGLVEVHSIKQRHDELASEMIKRRMNHKSQLPTFIDYNAGKINIHANIMELKRRCCVCFREH